MKPSEKPAKKQIITVAGRPGSGKSTTAKRVAVILGFHHFSSGDLFRALGRERGVDVLQANKSAGITEELDELVDSKLREIGAHQDKLVIDSRTAWHWIPSSFKVFLDLDPKIGARRILDETSDERLASEHVHHDVDEYARLLQHRLDVETERYKKIYDINPYDMKNYDLVIDTSANNIEETVEQVVKSFRAWKNS